MEKFEIRIYLSPMAESQFFFLHILADQFNSLHQLRSIVQTIFGISPLKEYVVNILLYILFAYTVLFNLLKIINV